MRHEGNALKKKNFTVAGMVDFVGSFMILSMVALSMFNIAGDWIFDRRYGAVEELILAGFVWVVYIGTGELYRSGEHICVDMLEKSLSERANRVLRILIDLVVLAVAAAVAYYAVALSLKAFDKYTPVLKLQYVYIDLAVIIGFASLGVYSARNIAKNLRLLAGKRAGEGS